MKILFTRSYLVLGTCISFTLQCSEIQLLGMQTMADEPGSFLSRFVQQYSGQYIITLCHAELRARLK